MSSIILAAVIGYLLGSIPFGLVLTRLAGLGDVRRIGSLTQQKDDLPLFSRLQNERDVQRRARIQAGAEFRFERQVTQRVRPVD